MLLYHEAQEAALCGVHTINTLLQGPCLTEWDLAKIAQDLDALERDLIEAQGANIAGLEKESGNVARDGMFSIQVRASVLPRPPLAIRPDPILRRRCYKRRLRTGASA